MLGKDWGRGRSMLRSGTQSATDNDDGDASDSEETGSITDSGGASTIRKLRQSTGEPPNEQLQQSLLDSLQLVGDQYRQDVQRLSEMTSALASRLTESNGVPNIPTESNTIALTIPPGTTAPQLIRFIKNLLSYRYI